jgi:hypothetical protein
MYQDDETIIIEEQISPTSEFHKMIDSWEEQYHGRRCIKMKDKQLWFH